MTKWLVLAGISGVLTYLSLGIGSLGLGMLFGFVTLIFLSFAHDEEEAYEKAKYGNHPGVRSKQYEREKAKRERMLEEAYQRQKERSSSDSET